MNTSRLKPRYSYVEVPHGFQDVQLDDDWNFGESDIVWCAERLEHLIDDQGVFQKICLSIHPN